MKIKLLGIDLAKNVFQICALNQANKVIFNRSIRRARSVITRGLKNRPELAQWVQPIIDRRGFNKAVAALANKLTRLSWVIVTTGEPFDMKQAFKPAT